jgi:hypothetical protein
VGPYARVRVKGFSGIGRAVAADSVNASVEIAEFDFSVTVQYRTVTYDV